MKIELNSEIKISPIIKTLSIVIGVVALIFSLPFIMVIAAFALGWIFEFTNMIGINETVTMLIMSALFLLSAFKLFTNKNKLRESKSKLVWLIIFIIFIIWIIFYASLFVAVA
jgi:hypothetical protein